MNYYRCCIGKRESTWHRGSATVSIGGMGYIWAVQLDSTKHLTLKLISQYVALSPSHVLPYCIRCFLYISIIMLTLANICYASTYRHVLLCTGSMSKQGSISFAGFLLSAIPSVSKTKKLKRFCNSTVVEQLHLSLGNLRVEYFHMLIPYYLF